MSYKFDHSIKANQKNERPARVIFLDVESKVIKRDHGVSDFIPFLWTACKVRFENSKAVMKVWGSGVEPSSFWDFVDEFCYDKTKVYLTSHHLEVDFMPMAGFVHLPARGWRLRSLISHGRVLILDWIKPKHRLIVMNNGNLFDGSIEQWGKILGVAKLPMPAEGDPMPVWVEYCKRDTEITVLMWEYLLNFLDVYDLGNFKMTKSSQAFNSFKHRFMSRQIAIHKDVNTIKLEKDSYHGGRFEAVQVGTWNGGKFWQLDVNSMYGSIMLREKLPYELRGYMEKASIKDLEYFTSRYAVVAEVDINTKENHIPHYIDKKLTYKAGDFLAILTTPELQYCLARGYITDVWRMAWYYQDRVLSDYARFFIDLKNKFDLEGNKPMRQITKLFLNSLYGKFGQKGYTDKIIGNCDPDIMRFEEGIASADGRTFEIAKYGGKIHYLGHDTVARDSFIAIASHITAYGRVMLHGLAMKAGYENVYHMATDSLIVNEAGYINIADKVDPTLPGKLKVEYQFKDLIIRDVNDLCVDGVDKIKGISRKAIQTGINSYIITYWTKMITLLKHGVRDRYYVQDIEKTLERGRFMSADYQNEV